MSGRNGRRVFHGQFRSTLFYNARLTIVDAGLPRVLADTLPSYLTSTRVDEDHEHEADIDAEKDAIDWSEYGKYLEGGARLNINVRQVFR